MNLKLKRTPGLFLVGFMASGKSTIGRELARELGWSFVDLDDDIEAARQMPIAGIFEKFGEAEFRTVESSALAARVQQIRSMRPLVVALGGGAFVEPGNAELIRTHGVSVWLDTPFELVQRRVAEANHRPLARDPEAFASLFERRRDAYAKADYRVGILSDDPAIAIRDILALPGLFQP